MSRQQLMALLAGGTSVLLYLRWRRRLAAQRPADFDYEAAFPTARQVAAYRAADANSPAPKIGSNVGGSADVAAEALAGTLGFQFADDLDQQAGAGSKGSNTSILTRTMFYDEQIMAAVDGHCRQIVLLACGLDTRAWRLPRLAGTTVYELDVPACHAYKARTLATVAALPPLACQRVCVAADLSEPRWEAQLLAAGFSPTEPSFILLEGLLMYLPPSTVPSLLTRISDLMSPGSTFATDCFCGALRFIPSSRRRVLAKYGTRWTYDAGSREAFEASLQAAGLTPSTVHDVHQPLEAQTAAGGADELTRDAARIARSIEALGAWPAHAKTWLLDTLQTDGGARSVVRTMVDDGGNWNQMRDKGAAHKEAVLERLLADGADATLTRLAATLAAAPRRSVLSRLGDWLVAVHWKVLMRLGPKNWGYLMFVARK